MSSLDPLSNDLFNSVEYFNKAIVEENFNNFIDFGNAVTLSNEIFTKQDEVNIESVQDLQHRAKANVLDKYVDEELVYGRMDSKREKFTFTKFGTKTEAQEPAIFNSKKNQVRLIKEFFNEAHELLGENFQIEMLDDNGEIIRTDISLGKPIEAREMKEFERAYIIYYTATNILKTRKEKSENNKQDKESNNTNKSPSQNKTSSSYNKKEISEKNKIEYDNSSRIKLAENEKILLRSKNIIQENEISNQKKHIMKKICKSKDECFEKIQLFTKNKNQEVERLKGEIVSSEFKIGEEEKAESFHNRTFTISPQGDFSTVSIEENCDGKISKVFQNSISDI